MSKNTDKNINKSMGIKYKVLSIAGFDGSGGAGLQADLKTFSALGCYGTTILTALPIQNTQGVSNCFSLPIEAIEQQFESIFSDITPDAIKIGMLFDSEIIELVSFYLERYAKDIPIVVDPVMIANSGDPLLKPNAIEKLKTQIISKADIVTPNLLEAKALSNKTELNEMGEFILNLGSKSVLIKDAHPQDKHATDYLFNSPFELGSSEQFSAPRTDSKHTHGTGCTLSAAIASLLAQQYSISDACRIAKTYISNAIINNKDNTIGKGQGPVHHFYHLWPVSLKEL